MEYVYEINPKTGERVGKVLRQKAHIEGIYHEVIHLWLINDNGEVLLQYRSANKSQYANCYHATVAGHIEYGDSIINTVIKEAKEEINFDINKSKLIKLFIEAESLIVPETGKHDNEYRHIFAYKINKNFKLNNLQVSEVQSLEWFKLVDLKEKLLNTDFYKKMLPHKLELYIKVIDMLIDLSNK